MICGCFSSFLDIRSRKFVSHASPPQINVLKPDKKVSYVHFMAVADALVQCVS
jgi:hypothetical protein